MNRYIATVSGRFFTGMRDVTLVDGEDITLTDEEAANLLRLNAIRAAIERATLEPPIETATVPPQAARKSRRGE